MVSTTPSRCNTILGPASDLFCGPDFGSAKILPITRPRRDRFFSGVGYLSIELSSNQASQEDRMTQETDRISLLEVAIVLLLLAAAAALSRPSPVF